MGVVAVLGIGMQGKAALFDISRSVGVAEVVAADLDLAGLEEYVAKMDGGVGIECVRLDASDEKAVAKILEQADVAIDLLPGLFSLRVAELAVRTGTHLVGSMYLADPAALSRDDLAKHIGRIEELRTESERAGVSILPELGLDPGIDLVMCGHAVAALDRVDELYSYGAGFPEEAASHNPIRYKTTWTLDGVLKSYRRPARIRRDGVDVSIPGGRIFDPEFTHALAIEPFGLLEAFANGDAVTYGERLGVSETAVNQGRFALRWPGHCEFWGKLSALGFLSDELRPIHGVDVTPRRFVHALLDPQLQYGDDESDVALVLVDARGSLNGSPARELWKMVDMRDHATGLTAMSRTVGFSTSIGAQMLLEGSIKKRGILSPTCDVPFDAFISKLGERGIAVTHSSLPWDGRARWSPALELRQGSPVDD